MERAVGAHTSKRFLYWTVFHLRLAVQPRPPCCSYVTCHSTRQARGPPNADVRHHVRLWTIHPRYLDSRGLVALWREALLARAVLRGQTRGYRHHPQLARFRNHRQPRYAINAYLAAVHAEARERGYSFDASKVGPLRPIAQIPTSRAQIEYEWRHLLQKLIVRNPALHRDWRNVTIPQCHPLFKPGKGPLESWERVGRDA